MISNHAAQIRTTGLGKGPPGPSFKTFARGRRKLDRKERRIGIYCTTVVLYLASSSSFSELCSEFFHNKHTSTATIPGNVPAIRTILACFDAILSTVVEVKPPSRSFQPPVAKEA